MLPDRHQAIIWTCACLSSIGAKFSGIMTTYANVLIQLIAFGNFVCKLAVTLYRPQCVNIHVYIKSLVAPTNWRASPIEYQSKLPVVIMETGCNTDHSYLNANLYELVTKLHELGWVKICLNAIGAIMEILVHWKGNSHCCQLQKTALP